MDEESLSNLLGVGWGSAEATGAVRRVGHNRAQALESPGLWATVSA